MGTNFNISTGGFNTTSNDRVSGTTKNEGLVTLNSLNVEVTVTEPTSERSYDGSISLNINGGTKPYIIKWSNGKNTTLNDRLTYGDYSYSVTDFFGDFIIEETVTIEDTRTVGLLEVNSEDIIDLPIIKDEEISVKNLCLSNGLEYYDLTYENTLDGRGIWIGENGRFNLNYSKDNNRWEIHEDDNNLLVKTSRNNLDIPTGNDWNLKGKKWNLTEGFCVSPKPELKVIKNDETCYGKNDGSAILKIKNGDIKDYKFRIKGVKPYPAYVTNEIFTKLPSGKYVVDGIDNEGNKVGTSFSIGEGKKVKEYHIKLLKESEDNTNTSKTKGYKIIVEPAIENNDYITMRVSVTHVKRHNCPNNDDGCLIPPDISIDTEDILIDEVSVEETLSCKENTVSYTTISKGYKEIRIDKNSEFHSNLSHSINTFDYTWANCDCKAYVGSQISVELDNVKVFSDSCYNVKNTGSVNSNIYLESCIKQ